jgi:hypothetical protein
MNTPFSVQFLLSLCSTGLLLWDRLQAQFTRLSRDQANTDSRLTQFMRDCERALQEFSNLCLHDSHPRTNHKPFSPLRPHVPKKIQKSSGPVAVQRQGSAIVQGQGVERKRQTSELATAGANISEILDQLKIPRGEVDLILNLSQQSEAVRGRG